jgi:hypothetical protein
MHSLTSSARRVAEMPELLFIISDFLGQHDRVSLIRVSRRTFACVVASLWKDIRNITLLLKLIPGVKITRPEHVMVRYVDAPNVCGFVVSPELSLPR